MIDAFLNQAGYLRLFRLATAIVLGFVIGLMPMTGSAQSADSMRSFMSAVRANDAAIVSRMAELGLNVRTRDKDSNNLLMLAIREDADKVASALLRQPAWQARPVLEQENDSGETALMLAAMKGWERVARRLIDLGAQVNRDGWTPLHYAAASGNVALIRMLVEKSAALDAESFNGATPLMMAARNNHQDAAKLLLELGADPTVANADGLTARGYAKENGNKNMEFWIELGEASYISKYLTGTLNADSESSSSAAGDKPADAQPKTKAARARKPSKSSPRSEPIQPVDDSNPGSSGTEVFKVIQ